MCYFQFIYVQMRYSKVLCVSHYIVSLIYSVLCVSWILYWYFPRQYAYTATTTFSDNWIIAYWVFSYFSDSFYTEVTQVVVDYWIILNFGINVFKYVWWMCVLTLLLLSPEGIANSSLFNFKIKVGPKVPKEWNKHFVKCLVTFCSLFHMVS